MHPRSQALPDVGPLPDPAEKRLACVSCRVAPEMRDGLRTEAASIGVTTSALLESMARNRIGFIRASGQSRKPDPLLSTIDQLRTEALQALADGRLTATERASLTRTMVDAMGQMWPRRARA